MLLLAGCANQAQTVRHGAEEAARNTLAFHLARRFGDAVQDALGALAAEGGYLDNPLVRILLPPPLGLVIDVARDLDADPRAALLEVLMNRAAENAIPQAAPILRVALQEIERADWKQALTGGRQAATDLLRERAEESVREALRPVIEARLALDGAVELYGDLLADEPVRALITELDTFDLGQQAVLVAPEALTDYVTDQAIEGLFRSIARRESILRQQLPAIRPAPPVGQPRDGSLLTGTSLPPG